MSNPVAQYFKEYSHSICEFFYFVIEQVHSVGQGGDIVLKRKSRETFGIFILDTLIPKGLNQEFDYCFTAPVVVVFPP